jgi:hypothetical protein
MIHLVAVAHLLYVYSYIKYDYDNNEADAIAVALLQLNISRVQQYMRNFNVIKYERMADSLCRIV